jgi:hypothetical protein
MMPAIKRTEGIGHAQGLEQDSDEDAETAHDDCVLFVRLASGIIVRKGRRGDVCELMLNDRKVPYVFPTY